jgi:transketolase
MTMMPALSTLKAKALWVRQETLLLHGRAPETRVASSLSAVELFVALHYAGIMAFDPRNPFWPVRDRLIISKGHGSICYYPILADLGYFDPSELERICCAGSFLGGIPDTIIPGYETINGSLGHGLGVACGMALALKQKGAKATIYVMVGDGELNEGSVWEGVMFAAQHRLDNIVLIIDNNKICMLDRCERIINLEPMEQRFAAFAWEPHRIDGHDLEQVCQTLTVCKTTRNGIPKVIIADTIKGKGVPTLETDTLCHIKSLNPQELQTALEGLS